MSSPATFGQWLARQLRLKGMSQADLAAELQVTRAAVSAWVTGRAEPRMEKIREIERILELPDGSVISRQDAPDPAGALCWYHRPAHTDGGREFGNSAAFAFSSDLRVLAREATQNSLDERLDPARPVRVRYTLDEISGERLARFLRALRWDDLKPHYDAAVADGRHKLSRILSGALDDLEERSALILLRVDDYNAKGLTGHEYDDGRFAAVVRRQLDSHKQATSGGSYGLGKATLWAASRLGLVLINSHLSEPFGGRTERRLIGRLDLPWRRVEENDYAGPAWLGIPDPSRDGAARSWWADERITDDLSITRESDEPGTSFLIVGAHDGASSSDNDDLDQMHESLVKSLADNFWACMIAPDGVAPLLEASVVTRRNGSVLHTEERVDPHLHQPTRARVLQAYYDGTAVDIGDAGDDPRQVVKAEVPLVVPALKETDGAGRSRRHDAVVLVASTVDDDPDANRIVGMRGNRMVVIDRKVSGIPFGTPPFQAVLVAGSAVGEHAEAAERFLRAAEPPEHNDWRRTDDLVATYKRGVVKSIQDFRREMLEAVRAVLQRPTERGGSTPRDLTDRVRMNPPASPRSPGYPTVKDLSGEVDSSGAWRVRVEVRLPSRADPWVLAPVLRFVTRSGPKPVAAWSEIRPESGCEITPTNSLRFTPGIRVASFSAVSDVSSHPVSAEMSVAEVDLVRAKEEQR